MKLKVIKICTKWLRKKIRNLKNKDYIGEYNIW
jgi:hypothetical protein